MKTVQVRNITLGEGRPKICVPIVGQTKDDILLEAGTFARIPVDVVEWRVDWFEDVFDTDKVLDVAKDLQTVLKDTPILFTFRTAKEGGEKAISNEAYKALNMAVAKSGYVDLIDVEAFTGEEIVKSMIQEAHSYGVKVIASNHDFDATPEKDAPSSHDAGLWRRYPENGCYAKKQTGRAYTLKCHAGNVRAVRRPPDHYHVHGRYRCCQPSRRRNLRFRPYLRCSYQSFRTRTDQCQRACTGS